MEFYGSKKAGSVVAVVLVWVGTSHPQPASFGGVQHLPSLSNPSIYPGSSSCYHSLDTPLMGILGLGLTKHLYTARPDGGMQGALLHIMARLFR